MFGFDGSSASVTTYTVHEPPQPEADRVDRASGLQFVKDGFSWLTALCPPLGLALSQLWMPLLAYVVFVGAFVSTLVWLGVDENWIALIVAALHIYLGFEHSTLQRWVLDQAGWQMLGSVTGKNLAECERRFFETWLPAQPIISGQSPGGLTQAPNKSAKSNPWAFGAKA